MEGPAADVADLRRRLDPTSVDAPLGSAWCRSWTERIDDVLSSCLGEASGVAVVGLGSYARRELAPASDVDVLLLHDGWATAELEGLVRAICYPLWDAGLSVGHAVHTPRAAVKAAAERVESSTSLVERRLVAGDVGLVDDLVARWSRWLRRHGGKLLASVADADASRHAQAGDRPGMLEPDLKRGAGGLRDLQSLRWASACLLGADGLDALVGARYLGASDLPALAEAAEVLLAARCALHLQQGASLPPGSGADTLRLDLQDGVATRLDWGDGDALLRAVGLASRRIAYLHGRAWPRVLADARGGRRRVRPQPREVDDGLEIVDGLVEAAPGRRLAEDPTLAVRAVAAAASEGTHLGRATAESLAAQIAELGALPWDAATRGALLRVLRRGREAVPALTDAGELGVLSALLPEWAPLRGAPQRNPLHRYDVDTHLVETVAELGAIVDGALDERHGAIFERLDEPEVLLLAALLHDVGKVGAGDHAVAGAASAREWVLRMGFGARRADRVARLVRLHLLLPDVAVSRDLDDADEITAVAERVGDAETLDGLYLLALADGRATGPAAASAWREGLLGELHARVRQRLTSEVDADLAVAPPAAVVADAERLHGGHGAVAAALEGMPRRYLLTASAEQVAEHARLDDERPVGEARAALRPGPVPGTRTLSLVAPDRVGLMADAAGALAGHGVVVLDARAFTRGDGVAFDWFVVDGGPRAGHEPPPTAGGGADGPPDGDEEVLTALTAAAVGAVDAGALVERWEGRRDVRRPALAHPVEVEVSFDRGPMTTRIEVAGPDAPGVLYRLGRVLADEGLDVVGARVATLGPQVRDVFFVRPSGGPPDESRLAERLRAAAGWPPEA